MIIKEVVFIKLSSKDKPDRFLKPVGFDMYNNIKNINEAVCL